jgi:DNA-binding transcriptional MerR regulator
MLQKTNKNYLTVSEAADRLNVSPETLRKWDRNGELSSFLHPENNSRVYLKSQIDDFIAKL